MTSNKFKKIFGCCSLLFVLSLFLLSCGKKAPPTLKEYERPEAPKGLTAVHREEKMTLLWSYPGSLKTTLKGFEVLRSEDGGFERIAFLKNSETVFIDEKFRVDVTYRYKVIARNLKDVPSADSNVVTVAPGHMPPPPEGLQFAVKADAVALSWKSSGEGVCYNIYKTLEKGRYSDVPMNPAPVCATAFADNALVPDRSVFYRIRALHNTPVKDEGYFSEEIEVNPSDFVPAAPTDPRVVRTDDKVFFMWKESSESWVKGYRVYRKIEGEQDIILLGEVKIPTFATERIGKKATYKIRAAGPERESDSLVVEVQ